MPISLPPSAAAHYCASASFSLSRPSKMKNRPFPPHPLSGDRASTSLPSYAAAVLVALPFSWPVREVFPYPEGARESSMHASSGGNERATHLSLFLSSTLETTHSALNMQSPLIDLTYSRLLSTASQTVSRSNLHASTMSEVLPASCCELQEPLSGGCKNHKFSLFLRNAQCFRFPQK